MATFVDSMSKSVRAEGINFEGLVITPVIPQVPPITLRHLPQMPATPESWSTRDRAARARLNKHEPKTRPATKSFMVTLLCFTGVFFAFGAHAESPAPVDNPSPIDEIFVTAQKTLLHDSDNTD